MASMRLRVFWTVEVLQAPVVVVVCTMPDLLLRQDLDADGLESGVQPGGDAAVGDHQRPLPPRFSRSWLA